MPVADEHLHLPPCNLIYDEGYSEKDVEDAKVPKQKFRGCWVHADIFALLAEKTITTTEAWTLLMVDSLVTSRGLGCWATNAHLASRIGVTVQQIQVIIRKLTDLGLLVKKGFVQLGYYRYRLMETKWSRIDIPGKVNIALEGKVNIAHSISSLRSEINKGEPASGRGGGAPKPKYMESAAMKNVFIPELEKENKTTKLDQSWTKELREKLSSVQPVHKYNPSKWGAQFRLLRTKDGYDPVLVQNVLEWFLGQYTRDTRPRIENAKQFRHRFKWIKDKYDQYQQQNPQITVSDSAKDIVRILTMQKWPKNSTKDLPVAVQVSLNGWKAFRSKLLEYVRNNPITDESPRHLKIAHWLAGAFPSGNYFVEYWFRQVHNSVANWDNWHGNLLKEVFDGDPNNKRFEKFVSDLITGHTQRNPQPIWSKIKESLK